jgi:hypothetical protein
MSYFLSSPTLHIMPYSNYTLLKFLCGKVTRFQLDSFTLYVYTQIFPSFIIFFAWSNFVVRWREKEALSFHRGRWKPVMKGCAAASKNRD